MNFKNRLFAAGVHLGISLVIAGLAWALVSRFLYPYPFIEISGGRQLYILLVSVDIVLGSMLTFSVFSSGKLRRVLVRDLVIIGVLQLTALGYGLWTMYVARPVYLVHEIDRFKVVTAADLDESELVRAPPEFRQTSVFGIKTIGLRPARDSADKLRSLDLELAGKELSLQTEWWQPLSDANRISMRQHGKPVQVLRQKAVAGGTELDRILRDSNVGDEEAIALPLLARLASWSIVLDKRDLRIIGYLPIDLF
jgi:hypothetical protein